MYQDRRYGGGRGGGGYRGRGGYRRGYKRSFDEADHAEPEPTPEQREASKKERIKALLVRIGEVSAAPLHKNLDMLSKALLRDLEEHNSFILEKLFECVTFLTTKCGIYGTLVGLLNARERSFGEAVVERLREELTGALAAHEYHKIRILVRFAGELLNANVIMCSSVVNLLEQILDMISDVHEDDKPKVADGESKSDDEDDDEMESDEDEDDEEDEDGAVDRKPKKKKRKAKKTESKASMPPMVADYFAYIVMSTLPYTIGVLNHNVPEDLAQIIQKIRDYMGRRKIPDCYRPLMVIDSFDPNVNSEYISSYWDAVETKWRGKSDWQLKSIVAPHRQFEAELEKSDQHTFSIDEIPSQEGAPNPRITNLISFFDQNLRKSTIPDPLDRCITFEYICDTLTNFCDNRVQCRTHLSHIPNSSNARFLMVETVFSCMLQLPASRRPKMLYASLLCTLLRKDSKTLPRVFGQCVNTMFDRMDMFEPECRDFLAKWFAFHLSNFSFKWPWNNWSFVKELKDTHPKREFCRETLRHCIELSNVEFAKENMPEDMHVILPHAPEPVYRYEAAMKLRRPGDKDGDGDDDMSTKAEPGAEGSLPTPVKSEPLRKPKAEPSADSNGGMEDGDNEDGESKDPSDDAEYIKASLWRYPDGKLPETVEEVCARQIVKMLETRVDVEELDGYLQECEARLSHESAREIFLESVFWAGRDSISTQLVLFERYKGMIKAYLGSHDDQGRRQRNPDLEIRVVELLFQFWQHSHQHLSLFSYKLCAYSFVTTQSLVDCLLSPHSLRTYYAPLLGEIVVNALQRNNSRIDKLQKVMIETQGKINDLENAGVEDDDEALRMAEAKLDKAERAIEQARNTKQSDLIFALRTIVNTVNAMLTALTEVQRKNDHQLGGIQGLLWYLIRALNADIKEHREDIEREVFPERIRPDLRDGYRRLLDI